MAQRTDQTESTSLTAFMWAIYSHPSLSVWSVRSQGDWLIHQQSSSSVGSGTWEGAGDVVQRFNTGKDHLTSIRVTDRHGTLQPLIGVKQRRDTF